MPLVFWLSLGCDSPDGLVALQAIENCRCFNIVRECKIGIHHHVYGSWPTYFIVFTGSRNPGESVFKKTFAGPLWDAQVLLDLVQTARSACTEAGLDREALALSVVQRLLQKFMRSSGAAGGPS